MIRALLVFLLAVPFPVQAVDDDWFVVTVGSRHHKRGYNEHNWGIGVEHGVSANWRVVAGTYRNSFYRQTLYVGATYTPLRAGNWRAGGVMFYASGYEHRPVTLLFPMLSYEQKNWGLNLGPISPTVVGFQVKFKID